MIIYNDKTFIKMSDYPDIDWKGNANWVLNDNDPTDIKIEEKIISLYPNFEFVFDENGKIIDVLEITSSITLEQIEVHKQERIQYSKSLLTQWLSENPYLHTDGKYYSCTEEKQALLNSNLASYERALGASVNYPLKWNSTGEECVEWTYVDLINLSLNIAAYVAPRVSKQQAIEVQIRNCQTIEEIDAVEIRYE